MKIIVNNKSSRTDCDVLALVASIVKDGLVSDFGTAFCYVTVFVNKQTSIETVVYAKKNSKDSHTFCIVGG